jgi:FkbM family methyltransferase
MVGTGLWLYRHTLKRIAPIHAFGYRVGSTLIGVASRITGFHTMEDEALGWRLEVLTGSCESETVTFVKRLVKPGMTVLDLGAHVGYYTKMFSRLVGESGRVVAFEPNPRTISFLKRNVGKLRNVTIVEAAASDHEETVSLYDSLPGSGGASLRRDEGLVDALRKHLNGHEICPRVVKHFPGYVYTVKAIPVDSYLSQAGIEGVDLIKMDIEGSEFRAICGMENTLRVSKKLSLVMEFNPRALKAFGVKPLDVYTRLRQLNLNVMQIIEDGTLRSLSDLGTVQDLISMLLDVPTGKQVNLLCQKGYGGGVSA